MTLEHKLHGYSQGFLGQRSLRQLSYTWEMVVKLQATQWWERDCTVIVRPSQADLFKSVLGVRS